MRVVPFLDFDNEGSVRVAMPSVTSREALERLAAVVSEGAT
jgi:hypothetical protein